MAQGGERAFGSLVIVSILDDQDEVYEDEICRQPFLWWKVRKDEHGRKCSAPEMEAGGSIYNPGD